MYERYKSLNFERHSKILTVTMDNPSANPTSSALHNELSYVFDEIEHDAECEVVVLTGAGRAFSAGGDLPDMLKACGNSRERAAMIARAPYIMRSLLSMSKPVIARVNGHAIGLGATLALLADVAIAVETAEIAHPHVNIGQSTKDGGAFLWPLVVGYARARQYLMSGESLAATEAARIGLIHKAVPPDRLDAEVMNFSDRLLAQPAMALRTTKRSINRNLLREAEALAESHTALKDSNPRMVFKAHASSITGSPALCVTAESRP